MGDTLDDVSSAPPSSCSSDKRRPLCRLVTFNVNGIRTLTGYAPWNTLKSFKPVLDHFDADIVCFQETKVTRDKLGHDIALVDGYDAYFSFCRVKGGYSGVATYVRTAAIGPDGAAVPSLWLPVAAEEGLNGLWPSSNTMGNTMGSSSDGSTTADAGIGHYIDPSIVGLDSAGLRELDSEGRCVITDHQAFVLFNCYFPNVGGGDDNEQREQRFEYKMNFNRVVQARCEALRRAGRHVVIAGDVNCIHREIDTCDMPRMLKMAGVTQEEFLQRPDRKWLHAMLVDGGGPMVDLFRNFYPDQPRAYTCWDTRTNARETNYGTRIDYVLADKALVDLGPDGFWDCRIMREVHGSDHCPVVADAGDFCLDESTITVPANPPLLCAKWMPEFSGKQQTLKAFMASRPTPSPTPPSPEPTSTLKRAASEPMPKPKPATIKKPKSGTAQQQPSIAKFFGSSSASSSTLPTPLADDLVDSASPTPSLIDSPATTTEASHDDVNADAKKQWGSMLSAAPRTPLCSGHREACALLTVTKQGPNQGRKFFICARPQGDKADKKTRCEYFEWSTRRSTDNNVGARNKK